MGYKPAPEQLHFGNMAYIRGRIEYRMSPFEQRPFAGLIKEGIWNTFRRVKAQSVVVGVPFFSLAMLILWANDSNNKFNRKQPGQFDNDV